MTKFCVKDIIIEELRERNLNIDDLLQDCAEARKREKLKELGEGIAEIFRTKRTPKRLRVKSVARDTKHND